MDREILIKRLNSKLLWTIVGVLIALLTLLYMVISAEKYGSIALCAVYEKDYLEPVLRYRKVPDNADTIYVVSFLRIRENSHVSRWIIPFPFAFMRTNDHYVDPIEYRIFNLKTPEFELLPSFVPFGGRSIDKHISKRIQIESKIEIIKDSLIIRNYEMRHSGLNEPFTYDIEIIQNHKKNRTIHVKNLVFVSKGDDDNEIHSERFIHSSKSKKWANSNIIYCYYYDTHKLDFTFHMNRDSANIDNMSFDIVKAEIEEYATYPQLVSYRLLQWVPFLVLISIIIYYLKNILVITVSRQNGKLSINAIIQLRSSIKKHFLFFILSNVFLVIVIVCIYLWLNPNLQIIDIVPK